MIKSRLEIKYTDKKQISFGPEFLNRVPIPTPKGQFEFPRVSETKRVSWVGKNLIYMLFEGLLPI